MKKARCLRLLNRPSIQKIAKWSETRIGVKEEIQRRKKKIPRRISKATGENQAVRKRGETPADTGQETVLDPNLKMIPQELRHYPNWVDWRIIEREMGKPGKPPLNPKTGRYAVPGDLDTCGNFAEAVDYWETNRGEVKGIGFDFTDSPFSGIDLDHCRNPRTGAIKPWAVKIVRKVSSYTEVTPSGTGLHILVKGKLQAIGRKKGNIEMYDKAHYFTITGHHLKGTPTMVRSRGKAMRRLYKRVFGRKNPLAAPRNALTINSTVGNALNDEELIEKAKKSKKGAEFTRLWEGNWRGLYPSESEADFALCHKLSFWTGRDAGRIDRLFRLSGLMREKWDSPRGNGTWGNMTIQNAIENTGAVYSPDYYRHRD